MSRDRKKLLLKLFAAIVACAEHAMFSHWEWKALQSEVVSAFAARDQRDKCSVRRKVLSIQLPAAGRHWDLCKAALLWPSKDLRAVLEVQAVLEVRLCACCGRGAPLAISVRSRGIHAREGNQLLWYLNKTKDGFLKEHLQSEEGRQLLWYLSNTKDAFLKEPQLHHTQETLKCMQRKLSKHFSLLLKVKSLFERKQEESVGARNTDGAGEEGGVHEGQEFPLSAHHAAMASLIVQLHDHLASRLEGAGSYCIICDTALPSARLWPSLCLNETCVTSFETMRRPGDLHLLATSPRAAELLISWARCVAADLAGENHREKLYLGSHSTPPIGEWCSIGKSLSKLPTRLPGSSLAKLERALRKADVALPGTLAWLFSTNRGLLLPLDDQAVQRIFPKEMLEHVPGIQVFLTYPSSESRMLAFQKRRETGGETKAFFHGALWPRWHSIVRSELKYLSGSHMNAGPSDPPGVYLSSHFEVSADYAYRQWVTSFNHHSRCCVALCEVAQPQEIITICNSNYFENYCHETVVKEEEAVLVRGLITYASSFPGAAFKGDRTQKVHFESDQLWKALDKLAEFRQISEALHGVPSGR